MQRKLEKWAGHFRGLMTSWRFRILRAARRARPATKHGLPPVEEQCSDIVRTAFGILAQIPDRTFAKDGTLDARFIDSLRIAFETRRPVQNRNVDELAPKLARKLSEMQHLRADTRPLVASAKGIGEAAGHLFADRVFRGFVRTELSPVVSRMEVERIIAGVSTSDSASASKPSAGAPRIRTAGGTTRYREVVFSYEHDGKVRLGSLPELEATLRSGDSRLCNAQLSGLTSSQVPLYVVVLWRRVDAGTLLASQKAKAILKMFAVRLYLSINAVASSYRLAESLVTEEGLRDELSAGEKTRARHLLARSALRSGQTRRGISLYLDLFAESPASPFALMNAVRATLVAEPALARTLAKAALIDNYAISQTDTIFLGDILATAGDFDHACAALLQAAQKEPSSGDVQLGLANLSLAMTNPDGWDRHVRRFFEMATTSTVAVDRSIELRPFSIRMQPLSRTSDHPRISVIMSAFNASETIVAAIDSVLSQTLQNIELIVVDDASTDETPHVLSAAASRDARIRILSNSENVGTYVSRNRGISESTGEYVTFHDSDDWMHPERLATHLESMNSNVACSTSNWIRMDASGNIKVRQGGPYTHVNPASTFQHRRLFEVAGSFDAVRVGADAEFLGRLRARFGPRYVSNLPNCLGIGLHHLRSLTQSGEAAFDDFRYSPVRLSYTEAWVEGLVRDLESGDGATGQ
ncbi:glycosyltransferase [Reyranella sp.]|uniref:glycosyltransferase n=1 Tax=Reyranella sp. TaxID=1929291 RepID=UPI003D153067